MQVPVTMTILGVTCCTAETQLCYVTLLRRPTKRTRQCCCASVCSEHRRAEGRKIKFQNREGWQNHRQGRQLLLGRLRCPRRNVTVEVMTNKAESGYALNSERNQSFPSSGGNKEEPGEAEMFLWSLIKSNMTLENHKWKTVAGNVHFCRSLKMTQVTSEKKKRKCENWMGLSKTWHSNYNLVTFIQKGGSTEEKITPWWTKCGSSTCHQQDYHWCSWFIASTSSQSCHFFYHRQENHWL